MYWFLLVLCCRWLSVSHAQVAYNNKVSPPAPVNATSFDTSLSSSRPLLLSDWTSILAQHSAPVVYATGSTNNNVRLTYQPDVDGNMIPDFSHAGFRGGGVPLPTTLDGFGAKVHNLPCNGDASDVTNLLAILAVVNKDTLNPTTGFRSVIQFGAGECNFVGQQVTVPRVSGLVFRGAGSLAATGTTLLCSDVPWFLNSGGVSAISTVVSITRTVPTGSYKIFVSNTSVFSVGSRVTVSFTATEEWLNKMQTNSTADAEILNKVYTVMRFVTAVGADFITIEAPMYYPVFSGSVQVVTNPNNRNLVFMNMRGIRTSGTPNLGVFIEAHGIFEDVYIKDVTVEYFGSLFQGAGGSSRRFTFEDVYELHSPIQSTLTPDIRQMFRFYSISEVFIHRSSGVYTRAFMSSNNQLTSSCIVFSHVTDLRPWRVMYYAFGGWFLGQLVETSYLEFGVDFGKAGRGTYNAISSVMWNNQAIMENSAGGTLRCSGPTANGVNVCVGNQQNVANLAWK